MFEQSICIVGPAQRNKLKILMNGKKLLFWISENDSGKFKFYLACLKGLVDLTY